MAFVSLALGWLYAAVYVLRRPSIHALLPERELFGRRQYDASEAELVAKVLDWSLVLWMVLPLALLACALLVAFVGVGHVMLLVLGVLSTPVFPMAGAVLPIDPVLAVIAIAQGVAAALVLVRFLRALSTA